MSLEARKAAKKRAGRAVRPADAVDMEIEGLHGPIIRECKRRGWRYIHSDPTCPTTVGEGVCDFIIFADQQRIFLFECKSKTGKLKMEQQIFITWLGKLKHPVHVIEAMSEFFYHVDGQTNVPRGNEAIK